ncbi:MAG: hypothetical protein GDA48_17765 [Hormoscilla sp. GM102CHS1]|nr:hypothetical protein [Hormoscilla sp. GM102CHS1]
MKALVGLSGRTVEAGISAATLLPLLRMFISGMGCSCPEGLGTQKISRVPWDKSTTGDIEKPCSVSLIPSGGSGHDAGFEDLIPSDASKFYIPWGGSGINIPLNGFGLDISWGEGLIEKYKDYILSGEYGHDFLRGGAKHDLQVDF